MIAKTYSIIPFGVDAMPIEIEGTTNNGLPGFNIVGMGSRTVSEARERVKAAVRSSGFAFPDQKLTINLAPADLEKDGTYLDLPIAINILLLSKQLKPEDVEGAAFVGELSLDGGLRPIRGIINIAEKARETGVSTLFLPDKNFAQGQIIPGVKLVPARSLTEIYLHLTGERTIKVSAAKTEMEADATSGLPSFSQVKGQELAKRALTIAVAGHHNILLSGPPGTGKTMLARAGLGLLPTLSRDEQIIVTKLHSMTGFTDQVVTSRPFRTPHHTSSLASLVGGGSIATPGEISLAHLGVLFLDELPEYPRASIEALRQPLEDKVITISRAKMRVTYPADFMLVATMNPCPCGYLGDPVHPCSCTEQQIKNYQKKLSGPLLDRIDLFTEVSRPKVTELLEKKPASKNVVKNTITEAIKLQRQRYQSKFSYNASVGSAELTEVANLKPKAKVLLDTASEQLGLSARSYFKIIRVARTIADLEQEPEIEREHLAEALTFRQK